MRKRSLALLATSTAVIVSTACASPATTLPQRSATQAWASRATLALRPVTAVAPSAIAQVYTTTADGRSRLTLTESPTITPATGTGAVTVDPTKRYQTMIGFGTSITGASAHDVGLLSAAAQQSLANALFSPTNGIGLSILRQPLGATDFNATSTFFSYDDASAPDTPLAYFSLKPDQDNSVISMVKAALRINPVITIIGTPWSAPGWMKTSGTLQGGSLIDSYVNAYAAYLTRAVQAYASLGVNIAMVTPANEPLFSNSTYPSMAVPATQETAIVTALDAAFTQANLPTKIWVYDDNWDSSTYPLQVLAATKGLAHIGGASFHCYSPDNGAIGQVVAAGYPASLSECTGMNSANTMADTLMWQTQNLVIGAIRQGASYVNLWNAVLDAQGGPNQGYCGTNCHALITVANGSYTFQPDYYVLGHASKFVNPGARRIDSTQPGGTVFDVAFQNPNGSFALILENTSGNPVSGKVVCAGRQFTVDLPPASVSTVVWS